MKIKNFSELYPEINVENLNAYTAMYLECYLANSGSNSIFIDAMKNGPFLEDECFKWNRSELEKSREMYEIFAGNCCVGGYQDAAYEMVEFYGMILV